MGGALCEQCGSGLSGDVSVLRDLPRPSIKGIKDRYSIWEYNTPFKITSFQAFKIAVEAAEAAESCKGFVTLDGLENELTTRGWSVLRERESKLCKALLSETFRYKGVQGRISKDTLLLYGILHCQDVRKLTNKSTALYELLQEGGFSHHNFIAAADKDLPKVFAKLCHLVTLDLFDFSPVKVKYDHDEREQLAQAVDSVLENQWLEDMYGVKAKL